MPTMSRVPRNAAGMSLGQRAGNGLKRSPAIPPPPPPHHPVGVRVFSPRLRGRSAMTVRNGARPFRRLAQTACVLLALVGLAPVPAWAQVEDYISNLRSQTFATNQNLVESSRKLSQPFETGSESGGYPLREVVLHLDNFGPRTIQVTIRENDGNGLPGEILYTLTNPASLSVGENTFTAPGGATLAADTRYHIVAEREGTEKGDVARWHGLLRREATIDNAGGWGINFEYLEKVAGGTPWRPAAGAGPAYPPAPAPAPQPARPTRRWGRRRTSGRRANGASKR